MELMNNNWIKITGKSLKDYENYHSILGEKFYRLTVEVKRRSGIVDVLPAIVSEKLLSKSLKEADFVEIEGQIRTHNRVDGSMEIFLFAKDINGVEAETYSNEVKLSGFLCKKGGYRETNSGRKVTDFILAVNRMFKKSDYLPVIAWGKDAKFITNKEIADKFEVQGRFQSRAYSKKNDDGTETKKFAYEISSSQIISIEE